MANSFMRFTSGGTAFTFTKPFLSTAHLIVEKNGTALTLTDDYTISGVDSYPYTTATITLNVAATTDDIIIIRRTTIVPADIMWKNFSDASVLKADELDDIQRYLVFLSQEADDEANVSLNEDFSQNFDAETKRIKNVAAPVSSTDAVNRSYVDSQTLYGNSAVTPQNWNKTLAGTTGNFSGNTGDVTCTLEDPIPAGDVDELFLVSIGGAFQRPGEDFTVTVNANGEHIMTLKGLPSSPADEVFPTTTPVNIRNYGVARNLLSGAIEAGSTSGTSLHVRKIASQTGDLQRWTNENNTGDDDATNILAKVAADGDATFVDINATGNADIDGNLNVDGNAVVDGTLSVDGNVTLGNAGGDAHSVNGLLTCLNGLTVSSGDVALTGNITSSGSNTKFIRQIVQATTVTGDVTFSNAAYKNTGLGLVITPQYTDSYIIVFGHHKSRVERAEESSSSTYEWLGSQIILYTGNTDHSSGATPDGTQITSSQSQRLIRRGDSTTNGKISLQGRLNIFHTFGPSDHTTDPFYIDVAGYFYGSNSNRTWYGNVNALTAIEIR